MLHDPEVYPDPHTFDPTRHIPAPGKEIQRDPRHACFGFARRICVGVNLAEASLFICVAMSLAVFNVSKAVDENGLEITPAHENTSGTIRYVVRFTLEYTQVLSLTLAPRAVIRNLSSARLSHDPRRRWRSLLSIRERVYVSHTIS